VPDEFLTARQIAELLQVNQQTVRNWIDRRELPAVRVGPRRVRVRRGDLDRFVEAGATMPELPEPEPAEVDEGSIAWATFGAPMAEATAALERTDQMEVLKALERLAEATQALVDSLPAERT
jgi:excisionase family DNA binding protein